jgi:hypothetical protein
MHYDFAVRSVGLAAAGFALQARVVLFEWGGRKIRLEPLPDGGLMAHWNQNASALLKGLATSGSGA